MDYYFKNLETNLAMATTYNDIGLVYDNQGDYNKALEFHFKSLEIQK